MILSFMERMVCSHFVGIMNSFSLDAETTVACVLEISLIELMVYGITLRNKTKLNQPELSEMHSLWHM